MVGRRGDVDLDAGHRPRVDEESADVRWRRPRDPAAPWSRRRSLDRRLPSYDCTDGSTATLAARPTVLDSDGAPDWSRDPVVVSLARWDRIKDPLGILDGFLERVLAATDAHLLLAGPDANQVADDPEAAAVLAEVRERWRRLPPPARARVHLACLPLTSPDENDAMVNAIQRQAAVVVKKSLQEGFGLGVTEAMWKARPVVASAVGGHLEQVQHLHSGLLVEDPADVGSVRRCDRRAAARTAAGRPARPDRARTGSRPVSQRPALRALGRGLRLGARAACRCHQVRGPHGGRAGASIARCVERSILPTTTI